MGAALTTTTLIIMGVSLFLMLIIPILPGQFIIWLAALVFGILDGWQSMGGGVFALLTLAMLVAAVADMVAGWYFARRGGASTKAIVVGFLVGFVGLVIFNAIGALVGILLGIMFVEYNKDNDWARAWKAGKGYLLGLLVSLIVRFFIALGMVGLFAAQVL